jgi:hypothetical protein
MSLSRFLWMLQNKMLWLARADTLNDPWELALAGDQLEHVIMRRPIRPLGSTKPEEPTLGCDPLWAQIGGLGAAN